MSVKPQSESEYESVKKWRDRSLLFWIGLVIGGFALLLVGGVIVNFIFPAPHWGDISLHGCVMRDSLLLYYACDGFTGAAIVEFLRNMPLQFYYMLTFYPYIGYWPPVLVTIAAIVVIAWGLRTILRVLGRHRQESCTQPFA